MTWIVSNRKSQLEINHEMQARSLLWIKIGKILIRNIVLARIGGIKRSAQAEMLGSVRPVLL